MGVRSCGHNFSAEEVDVVGDPRVVLGEGRRRAEGEDGEVAVVAAFAAEGQVYVG